MNIAKAVAELAIKHHVNVRRDHHGMYEVWKDGVQSYQDRYIAQSSSGAIARIRRIVKLS